VKLFIDSADVFEIRAAVWHGISGVTTNPSLLAKAGGDPMETLRQIVDAISWADVPLSVELLAEHEQSQMDEAHRYVMSLKYSNLVFKVPMAWDSLPFASRYPTNVTAVMSFNQAIMAANAGAVYVSLFWGRIADIGGDPAGVVRQVRESLDRARSKTEIIVGSIRQMRDVNEAIQAGAHIVTVPPAILRQMCQHPQTDVMVAQFNRDAGR